MREIKFRAWDKEHKKMDYAPYVYAGELNDLINGMKNLMQYTGLKDKNGKEIYCSDILKQFQYYNNFGDEKENEYRNGLVVWVEKEARWQVREHQKHPNGYEADVDCNFQQTNRREIIGNIYEQPELVESSR